MQKSIIVVNDKPLEAWREVIKKFQPGCPLFVETDLSQLDLDSCLFKKYYDSFKWHFRDSHRSLMIEMQRALTRYEFSYYDRIHTYFGVDQLKHIRNKPNDIICNWDPVKDPTNQPKPCFITLKLIPDGKHLNISVTFRTRDVIRRLYPNWVVLFALLQEECKLRNRKPGKLFDYSNQVMARKEDLLRVNAWDEFDRGLGESKNND